MALSAPHFDSPVQNHTCLALRPGYRLQWEPRQGAWVLLFPEGMVVLSETAHLILQRCQAPIAAGDLITQLEAQYPGEDIREDILEFLDDALAQAWLEAR